MLYIYAIRELVHVSVFSRKPCVHPHFIVYEVLGSLHTRARGRKRPRDIPRDSPAGPSRAEWVVSRSFDNDVELDSDHETVGRKSTFPPVAFAWSGTVAQAQSLCC